MKKYIVLLIATFSIFFVGCETNEVSAEFFGNSVVINSSENKELSSLIDEEIAEYSSELTNVVSTDFIVKINDVVVDDYKTYEGDIETIKVDVREYILSVKEEVIDFGSLKIEDYSISTGTSKVEVKGVEGLKVTNVTELYVNGQLEEVVDEVFDEVASFDPVDEVIRVGMKQVDDENPKFTKETCEKEIENRKSEDEKDGIDIDYVCILSQDGNEYQIQIIQ